jgi:NAD(P)-dependent dehydrogenase (short-subunit alcohol dehydrogenase family)
VTEFRQKEYDIIGVVADVSNAGAVEDLARKTLEQYGKVHILCNNAGVVSDSELGALGWGQPRPLWDYTLKDWHWTFNVNFWGVVHGIKTFLPLMAGHGEPGHVVNTSSIAGLTSGAGLPIYGASKHAVVRISEALYLQLKALDSPVSASVLCPGGVRTRIALASRNRPDELYDEESRPDPAELEAREQEWATRTGDRGMAPEQVADIVFDAIRDDRFYILPHDEYDPVIRARADAILTRQNPATQVF